MNRHHFQTFVAAPFSSIISLVVGAFLVLNQPASAAATLPTSQTEVSQACQELITARIFAFGGVGFAGTISQGEKAFRVVFSSTNALELFEGILANGTPAGRLYALCGIRRLAPSRFTALSENVPQGKVLRMSGCLATEEDVSAVIAAIDRGFFDLYLQPARHMPGYGFSVFIEFVGECPSPDRSDPRDRGKERVFIPPAALSPLSLDMGLYP
jgi:hypothetical protein